MGRAGEPTHVCAQLGEQDLRCALPHPRDCVQPRPLRFKLSDSATGQPLKGLADVQVLAFEPPGVWQQRQWAKDVGEGEYEVAQVFPRTGLYKVMLRVTSRGVSFADLPAASVPVTSGTGVIEKGN